jgi:2-iminoacetate synthase ThiH
MDLKEVVSVMVLVDNARWLLKTHAMKLSLIGEDNVTDQTVEEKINEMRKNYASLATVVERIHKKNLKETTMALLGIHGMESLLKLRALVILES